MKKGFSLIELLIVLVVLGTLMVWVLPQFLHTVEEEHKTQQTALDQARALQGVLDARGKQQQLQLDRLEQTIQKLPQKTKRVSQRTK